jgi:hypothetical protein
LPELFKVVNFSYTAFNKFKPKGFSMLQKLSILGLFCLFYWGSAHAGLMSPTDDINGLDLRWGHTESNQIQAFNEAQNIYIHDEQIKVDFLLGDNLFIGDSFRGSNHSNSNLSLAAGNYNSHLLHFDSLGTSSGHIFNSRLSFEEDIVAIILGGKYLNLSDDIFGGIDTIYQKNNSRRLEAHDFLTFESSNTLVLDQLSIGRYWIDNARVITQAVPEPGSIALLSLGLLGLFFSRAQIKTKEKS